MSSSSFTDHFYQLSADSPVADATTKPFDDGYFGYDPRLQSQRFDSFSNFDAGSAVDGLLVFTSHSIPDAPSPPPIHVSSGGFVPDQVESLSLPADVDEELFNSEYVASDGPILPPPMEMQPEEGFALREWRRQNAIRLEAKESREKELLSQIINEAEAYKVEFHRKRQLANESNKVTNREKEQLFLSSQEKFHTDADKNYWKAIAELIPNEVPTIEKKGRKKDQEKQPSIIMVQGPKPGKPTELSRMRQIVLKLKHNTPNHLKRSPRPLPDPSNDAKTVDDAPLAAPSPTVAVA